MTARKRFPRCIRITKDRDFKRILFQGEKFRGESINVHVLRSEKRAFGISISKRIKGAVLRNRIKRVFKEHYRLNQDRFDKNHQILVIIHKDPGKIGLDRAGEMITDLIRSKSKNIYQK